MGSSRLPGKVLKLAGGKPFLLHQVERIRRARLVDEIIVATTVEPQDDAIVSLCESHDIRVFRGSEDDVLGRVAACLQPFSGWGHVELVGDSPFIDPQMIDEFIGYFLKNQDEVDYVSNGIEITYPNGAEVNVYSVDSLLDCNRRVAVDDPMREHVDIHLYQSGLYRCSSLEAPSWLRYPDFYIEIDTDKDYQVLKSIGDYFQNIEHFSLSDIVRYLTAHPEVADINRQEHRKYWEIKKRTYE
jgi:spore coat polysaccharide biosynthesis protein SpsF